MRQAQRHDAVALHHRNPLVDVEVEELRAVLVGAGVVDQQTDLETFGGRQQFSIRVRSAEVE
jgi:hypothetical protein